MLYSRIPDHHTALFPATQAHVQRQYMHLLEKANVSRANSEENDTTLYMSRLITNHFKTLYITSAMAKRRHFYFSLNNIYSDVLVPRKSNMQILILKYAEISSIIENTTICHAYFNPFTPPSLPWNTVH